MRKSPVALRKESVDRNRKDVPAQHNRQVALRKESVDRNPCTPRRACDAWRHVALRKESVDRNS